MWIDIGVVRGRDAIAVRSMIENRLISVCALKTLELVGTAIGLGLDDARLRDGDGARYRT